MSNKGRAPRRWKAKDTLGPIRVHTILEGHTQSLLWAFVLSTCLALKGPVMPFSPSWGLNALL